MKIAIHTRIVYCLIQFFSLTSFSQHFTNAVNSTASFANKLLNGIALRITPSNSQLDKHVPHYLSKFLNSS